MPSAWYSRSWYSRSSGVIRHEKMLFDAGVFGLLGAWTAGEASDAAWTAAAARGGGSPPRGALIVIGEVGVIRRAWLPTTLPQEAQNFAALGSSVPHWMQYISTPSFV